MKILSPCLDCGACCVRFKVSYYWGESVPNQYFVETTPMFRTLKSTDDENGRPRCNALSGKVGVAVSCLIYLDRPSPCQDFQYSYEDGKTKEIRCDEARAVFGLLPLAPPKLI